LEQANATWHSANWRALISIEGFHHQRYSAERERSKQEQMLKFRLLPLGFEVIWRSGTVQEYRKIWQAIGKKRADGMRADKVVEYWGLVAIIGPRRTGSVPSFGASETATLHSGASCAGRRFCQTVGSASRRSILRRIEPNQKAARRRRFDVLAFQLT